MLDRRLTTDDELGLGMVFFFINFLIHFKKF